MAILLKEWANYHPDFSFVILATDIDAASVRGAERGEFSPESIKKLPRPRALRWFQQEESKVIASNELKRTIHFRTHDLMGKWSPVMSGFHLILCRNLLIYLMAAQQQSLYTRFAEALVPGGYLVLGQTETLLGAARQLYRCVDVHHRIYQTIKQGSDSRPSGPVNG